ncbi:cyclic nucleotide-binding-like protein [Polychytrium aggregatum]|uniref:cyclic nucleotide-binding-like protein n=1 Tax=Polychytrium aggregatum TaxID=110093 RepID=UPI0022FEABEC|nr:cyclic nucleotide-binding-like protein [Polychytrium aggregatum]KAI9202483.1 cyclic nucleotide-binding-like protein [Polychytrium aggregatum]
MAEHFSPELYTVPVAFPAILKDLNKEVLKAQPADIYQFCANYFQKKLEEQRVQLIQTASGKTLVPAQSTAGAGAAQSHEGDHDDDDASDEDHDDDNEEEEEEDDEEDEEPYEEPTAPPQMPATYNRGRRTSVSAESMAPTLDKDFVKTVIPKTEEQKGRIERAIKNNFLFKSLDEEQYVDVVNAMAEKRVLTGEEVIKQGGIGDYFYCVEIGTLDVYVSRNGQPPIKVFNYEAGGSFGELALMYNAPRAATVVATSDCVLWALDRVTFRRILMENTSRKRRMYEDFLEEVPLLISLEPYERHKIADALESVTFNDGEVVIRQGEAGDAFFIIENGEATVTQTDDNGVDHSGFPSLKKGDYFGELALLTDKPRKATITARGRLKCATLGKKAFVRLLGPVVDIIKRNASNYQTFSDRI